MEKVDNLCGDLGIEEQPKDLRSDFKAIKRGIRSISNPDLDNDLPGKLSIVFKPFNLRMKIPENVLYIVIKSGIYIYSKDL